MPVQVALFESVSCDTTNSACSPIAPAMPGGAIRSTLEVPDPTTSRRVSHAVFVAIRDLCISRWRTALMGAAVVLITLLVGLLSGLTVGLGRDNTSAITELPGDHIVFSTLPVGQGISFADSVVGEEIWGAWTETPGVTGLPRWASRLSAPADRAERSR